MQWHISLLLMVATAVHCASGYRSVCYYTNWAQYRHGVGKFVPEDVDPHLCTHVIYAFAKLQGTQVQPYEWNDESTAWSTGMYERMMALKQQNPALKVMLGIGGWNMASAPFTAIAGTQSTRQQFAQSLVAFLRKHNFDGYDNDWEYPANRGSPPQDKQNDVLLMQEVRRTFDQEAASSGKPRLLLSTAVSVGKDTIDSAYDVPALSRVVDFFNVMSYDIHGSFDGETGHNAPLFPHTQETGKDRNLNVNWAVQYYISLGMPRDKINLGIPTYGRSFTLPSSAPTGLKAQAKAGDKGHFTQEAGFMAYYEVCEKLQTGAAVTAIPSQHAVYLQQGDQWVGYDDVHAVEEKACYAKQMGLGGVMYWALDLDDFKGQTCGQGKYPLINAANREFQAPGFAKCPNKAAGAVTPAPVAPTAPPPATYFPVVTPQPLTPRPQPATYMPVTQAPPAYTAQPVTPAPGGVVPSTGFSCVGKQNAFYEDPQSCGAFYICASQQAFKVQCARGLMYNPAVGHCDWASNTQCGLQTIGPVQPTQQPFRPTAAPYVPPVTQAPYVPPVTNAPYVPPVTNAPYVPPVTNAPYVPPVTNAPYVPPVTAAPGPVKPHGQNGPDCTKQTGLFKHISDCRKYVQCSNGAEFVMTCPNQLLFNPALGRCDFPSNVPQCFTSGKK